MNELNSERNFLKKERKYGISAGILYGVGCGIGGSLFVLLGTGIKIAGPGVLISLLLGTLLILLIALNYSELSASLPISGGAYNFSKEAMGGFAAFIIGFFLWIANIATCAFSAQALGLVIGIFFPFLNNYFTLMGIAIISVLFISLIYFRTQRFAIRTLIVSTILLLIIFAIFIFSGLFISPATNPSGYNFNYISSKTSFFSIIQIFALFFILFTSITSNLAYFNVELKNPSRNIPKVNILAILFTAIIYIAIVFIVLINIGPNAEKLSESPVLLGDILYKVLGPIGFYLMGFAILISILIAMNAALGSAVSVFKALSRDHYFPKRFNKLSKKKGVPVYSLIITTVIAILFTFIAVSYQDIGITAEITTFIYFFGLSFVNIAAVYLRYKRKELNRPFKAPFFPYLPIIVAVSCLILSFVLDPTAIILGLIIFTVAVIYYSLTVTDRHSLVMALAGIKFFCVLLVIFFIWALNNLSIMNFAGSNVKFIFYDILLRILIFICIITIITIFLDIIPLRELIYFFTKKIDKNKVAINLGFGQIIELEKQHLKMLYRANLFIASLQIIGSFFIFFIIYLFLFGYVSILKINFRTIAFNQSTAEYLFLSCLLFFSLVLLVSGFFMIYINKEIVSLGV